MTREEIEKDLAEHRRLLRQSIADSNAISGVVQYLEKKLADVPAESRIIKPDFVPVIDLKKKD